MSCAFNPERVDKLVGYVIARRAAQVHKESGASPPHTDDPIIQTGRFTCIQREDDRVTRTYAEQFRGPHGEDRHLGFATAIWVLVNEPATLRELGYPVPWNAARFIQVLADREARGERNYNGAYTIAAGAAGVPKPVHQARNIFDPLWRDWDRVRPRAGDTIASFYDRLIRCNGIGQFIAGQIIACLKYVEPLKSAPDWQTWAISGPGSGPGMNWLVDRPIKSTWIESEWHKQLLLLITEIAPRLEAAGIGPLHAQDYQNILCEINKYFKEFYLGLQVRRLFAGQRDGVIAKPRPKARPKVQAQEIAVDRPAPIEWCEVQGDTAPYHLNAAGDMAIGPAKPGSSWFRLKFKSPDLGWCDGEHIFRTVEEAKASVEPPPQKVRAKRRRKTIMWLVVIRPGSFYPEYWLSSDRRFQLGQRADDGLYQIVDRATGQPAGEPADTIAEAACEFEGIPLAKLKTAIVRIGDLRIEDRQDGRFGLVRFNGADWEDLGVYDRIEDAEAARAEPRMRGDRP